MANDREHITRILQQGDLEARAELLPLVYGQLREIARQRMANERGSHTLQATALVHEAYLRLVGDRALPGPDRAGFYAAASEAMRRILIDHARRKKSVKRGGGATPLPLDVLDLAVHDDPIQILAFDEALGRLAAEDARAAEVVRLRFFAGLGVDETAEVLATSRRTVLREWAFARARLFELLQGGDG
jgi:RNA polymerase sigma factor (TIGR02999 family)